MRPEERAPRRRGRRGSPAEVLGDSRFGDLNAQFLEFAMNALGAPERIRAMHLADQRADVNWIGGRPRRGCADRQRQCHANRRRCHETTVAGFTICTASRQPLHTRESSTHKSRSARLSRSRRGAACWRTASWWRRATISASSSARVRKLDRIAARRAVTLGHMRLVHGISRNR